MPRCVMGGSLNEASMGRTLAGSSRHFTPFTSHALLLADNLQAQETPMAARATWKGYLKISLVNIPIRVFPATDAAATISFNQLHRECGSRIQQKRWCPTCQTEVANTDLVKGYEFEKGRYVTLTDDDLAKVRPQSTHVINVVQFTDAATIDPVYVEKPYYLAPDGDDVA